MVRLLWIAVVLEWLVILWQPFSPYSATIAVLAFFGTLAWLITLKLLSWDAQARERRRLLDDAEIQHRAWKAGLDDVATFGTFQPPWVVLHPSECTPGQCVCGRLPNSTGRPPPPPIDWQTEQVNSI